MCRSTRVRSSRRQLLQRHRLAPQAVASLAAAGPDLLPEGLQGRRLLGVDCRRGRQAAGGQRRLHEAAAADVGAGSERGLALQFDRELQPPRRGAVGVLGAGRLGQQQRGQQADEDGAGLRPAAEPVRVHRDRVDGWHARHGGGADAGRHRPQEPSPPTRAGHGHWRRGDGQPGQGCQVRTGPKAGWAAPPSLRRYAGSRRRATGPPAHNPNLETPPCSSAAPCSGPPSQ